ncbi:MAG: DUF465 domain-containing protein [Candidatus Dadabacteria bacterium]|nr:MAG: DUF465 domain-containing protein [Candidatus Dadabacteria bacterium]
MEEHERELILKLSHSNRLLRELYEEHLFLDDIISKYESKPYITPDEELETKRLKKKKLLGVDRMMAIIHDQRVSH